MAQNSHFSGSRFRLKDDMWFILHQDTLLRICNDPDGRKLLGINTGYPRIVKITKESITWLNDVRGNAVEFVSRIRPRAPYGDAVREKWPEIVSLGRRLSVRSTLYSPLTNYALGVFCVTDTFSPDPNPETATVDGRTGCRDGSWSTARSGGGTDFVTSDSGNLITTTSQESGGTYFILRGIHLYNTGPTIPSLNTVTAASIDLTCDTNFDGGGAQGYAVITASNPASDTAIAFADFPTVGSVAFSNTQDLTGWSAGTARTFTLNASGIAAIAKGSGVSKYGVRDGYDMENVTPGSGFQSGIDMRSAETGSDPVLTVTHVVPVAADSIIPSPGPAFSGGGGFAF